MPNTGSGPVLKWLPLLCCFSALNGALTTTLIFMAQIWYVHRWHYLITTSPYVSLCDALCRYCGTRVTTADLSLIQTLGFLIDY